MRRDENYTDGVMTDGKCYDESGNEIPYFPSQVKPEYPGGVEELYKYVAGHFKKKKNDTGKIIVKFVIEKDGSITDPVIMKGINPELDAEALRVISSLPKWTPGSQEGRPVRVQFSIPITLGKS